MSAYSQMQTQITDADILKECLKEKGYGNVEHHQTAQQLVGYHGDNRKQTAEIIIRRKHISSASNDIGFKKQADGTYGAIISDYDKIKHTDHWMTDLKKMYAEKKTMKQAKISGLKLISKKVSTNGSCKLNFVKA